MNIHKGRYEYIDEIKEISPEKEISTNVLDQKLFRNSINTGWVNFEELDISDPEEDKTIDVDTL